MSVLDTNGAGRVVGEQIDSGTSNLEDCAGTHASGVLFVRDWRAGGVRPNVHTSHRPHAWA